MPHPKPISALLNDLLATGDVVRLRSLLREVPPGESARLVSRLDRTDQRQLLTLLPPEDAAQVLKELSISQAAQLLLVLPAELAAALVELFPSNEQADLLAELGNDSGPILASLSTETAQRVRRLEQHRADTAGGLMVTEYLS